MLSLSSGLISGPIAAQDLVESVGRSIEEPLMLKLQAVKQRYPNSKQPFTTDGCSGGLTSGWIYLTNTFPLLKEKIGQRTPIRTCCEAHDAEYWNGDTVNGFDKRLAADQALRQCVIDTGAALRDKLTEKYHLHDWEVDLAFKIAANSMYHAVRLGGAPCTVFSWRWGYGYPECDVIDNHN